MSTSQRPSAAADEIQTLIDQALQVFSNTKKAILLLQKARLIATPADQINSLVYILLGALSAREEDSRAEAMNYFRTGMLSDRSGALLKDIIVTIGAGTEISLYELVLSALAVCLGSAIKEDYAKLAEEMLKTEKNPGQIQDAYYYSTFAFWISENEIEEKPDQMKKFDFQLKCLNSRTKLGQKLIDINQHNSRVVPFYQANYDEDMEKIQGIQTLMATLAQQNAQDLSQTQDSKDKEKERRKKKKKHKKLRKINKESAAKKEKEEAQERAEKAAREKAEAAKQEIVDELEIKEEAIDGAGLEAQTQTMSKSQPETQSQSRAEPSQPSASLTQTAVREAEEKDKEAQSPQSPIPSTSSVHSEPLSARSTVSSGSDSTSSGSSSHTRLLTLLQTDNRALLSKHAQNSLTPTPINAEAEQLKQQLAAERRTAILKNMKLLNRLNVTEHNVKALKARLNEEKQKTSELQTQMAQLAVQHYAQQPSALVQVAPTPLSYGMAPVPVSMYFSPPPPVLEQPQLEPLVDAGGNHIQIQNPTTGELVFLYRNPQNGQYVDYTGQPYLLATIPMPANR